MKKEIKKEYLTINIVYNTQTQSPCVVCGNKITKGSVSIVVKKTNQKTKRVCMNESCCNHMGLSNHRHYALVTQYAPDADDRNANFET